MRNSTYLSQTAIVFIAFVALVALARSEDTELSIHIDHVMVGASNLDRAVLTLRKQPACIPSLEEGIPVAAQRTRWCRWDAALT